jgi:hypothetical protein
LGGEEESEFVDIKYPVTSVWSYPVYVVRERKGFRVVGQAVEDVLL